MQVKFLYQRHVIIKVYALDKDSTEDKDFRLANGKKQTVYYGRITTSDSFVLRGQDLSYLRDN